MHTVAAILIVFTSHMLKTTLSGELKLKPDVPYSKTVSELTFENVIQKCLAFMYCAQFKHDTIIMNREWFYKVIRRMAKLDTCIFF